MIALLIEINIQPYYENISEETWGWWNDNIFILAFITLRLERELLMNKQQVIRLRNEF